MTANSQPTQTSPFLTVICDPADDALLQEKARSLAQSLSVNGNSADNKHHSFLLVYTVNGLELQTFSPETTGRATILTTNFLSGNTGYRRLHGGGIHQPLARAVGIKPGRRPAIVDATAGLGVDSFILAALGCRVTMIERSPVIGALLADGLERAASHPATETIMERIHLLLGNARELITALREQPDTVYLDPMYPHRHGSALNKKTMRIIRELVGDDHDAGDLLEAALNIAGNRVVVKRPKGAPELSDRRPTHIVTMKNSRFDVYLTGISR